MSIEVKQLIVKSTIVSERRPQQQAEIAQRDLESLKQEVIEQCRELVEQSLDEMRER